MNIHGAKLHLKRTINSIKEEFKQKNPDIEKLWKLEKNRRYYRNLVNRLKIEGGRNVKKKKNN